MKKTSRAASKRKVAAVKKLMPDNRRRALLDAAARHFGKRGFEATSIRDIAAAVGMLPGSLYYHFASKEALLLAVHQEGVEHIQQAVEAALRQAPANPWDRLEAACVAHLVALVGGNEYAQVVTPQFTRAMPAALSKRLIQQRDAYETIFADLVNALTIPRSANVRYLRLALLGSLNWTLTWYHAGADSPAHIAHQVLHLFRIRLDDNSH